MPNSFRAEQRQLAATRVLVEQLRREARITRVPLDETTREMLEFVAEREAADPLLQKNDPDGCPFMCLPIGRNK